MIIPINDRRVIVNGARPNHAGLIEITLKEDEKNKSKLKLSVVGCDDKNDTWFELNLPPIHWESLNGKASLDCHALLDCRLDSAPGSLSINKVLDLLLQELLVEIRITMFRHGDKSCHIDIRGLEGSPLGHQIMLSEDDASRLFTWHR